jgi:hypothetical protein
MTVLVTGAAGLLGQSAMRPPSHSECRDSRRDPLTLTPKTSSQSKYRNPRVAALRLSSFVRNRCPPSRKTRVQLPRITQPTLYRGLGLGFHIHVEDTRGSLREPGRKCDAMDCPPAAMEGARPTIWDEPARHVNESSGRITLMPPPMS